MYIPKDNKIIAVNHGLRYFPWNLGAENESGDSNNFFPLKKPETLFCTTLFCVPKVSQVRKRMKMRVASARMITG